MFIETDFYETNLRNFNMVTKISGKEYAATISTVGGEKSDNKVIGLNGRLYETMAGITIGNDSYLFDHDGDLQGNECPFEFEYNGSYWNENDARIGHEKIVQLISNLLQNCFTCNNSTMRV